MKETFLIHAGFWFGIGMCGSWCTCLLVTWFLAKKVIVRFLEYLFGLAGIGVFLGKRIGW
jgi:hypothetical protein